MRVSVSNIAWEAKDDDRVAEQLLRAGVSGVEVAPTTRWPDPTAASAEDVAAYRGEWADRGLVISSLQALLYGREDLVLFQEEAARESTLQYLAGIARLAGGLGAGPMVFGSPRNRRVGDLDPAAAWEIAVDFFRRAAVTADERGTVLCLEANPPEYGADFATNTRDAFALVQEVAHPGFGLHLDLGGMQIGDEPIGDLIEECAPWIRHLHVSEPHLAPVGRSQLDHRSIAETLTRIAYPGWISIEMRRTEDALADVVEAARLVVESYGDGC